MTNIVYIWSQVCRFLGVPPMGNPSMSTTVQATVPVMPEFAGGQTGYYTAAQTVGSDAVFTFPVPVDEYWQIHHVRMELGGAGVDISRLVVADNIGTSQVIVISAAASLQYDPPKDIVLGPTHGIGIRSANYVSDETLTMRLWRTRWRVQLPQSP